jgi:hypothetical protein
MESTVARRLPSELNVMIMTPRGGPDDSGLMLEAEELEVSAYSASPRALVNRSRQIVGACWSDGKTCDRVIEDENCYC